MHMRWPLASERFKIDNVGGRRALAEEGQDTQNWRNSLMRKSGFSEEIG
jgi:hypothetical protein